MAGKDIIGCAQTGTGKTGAFCIPALNRMIAEKNSDCYALVLAPTRELALQIELFWKNLTRNLPHFRSCLIVGGMPIHFQARQVNQPGNKRPRLIVATPGRLADLIQRRMIQLKHINFLVLDEADRMLDMGFEAQLNLIVKHLPLNRQTLFFTATWERHLDQVAKKYLKNPEQISVGPVSKPVEKIDQEVIHTTVKNKNETLLNELKKREGSILVFAKTKSRTDRVARYLSEGGLSVNRLHGGRSQGQRFSALTAFRTGRTRILIATDIAARGIDVKGIAHVVNYDLPQCSDDYIHRIGRTGRAGASGQAVSLLTPEDNQQWHRISKLLKRSQSPAPRVLRAAVHK